MRITGSLERKIRLRVTDKILSAYSDLSNTSACAGVRNDADNAKEARINHHGAILRYPNGNTAKLPARRFVDVAARNTQVYPTRDELKQFLKENLKAPAIRGRPRTFINDKGKEETGKVKSTLAFGTTGSADKLMQRVADKIRVMQEEAIINKNFGRGGTKQNAESTRKRKERKGQKEGAMIAYGWLKRGLYGWTE